MSECSGPQLSNTYDNQRIGTIGQELPGFWNKIDVFPGGCKGEICAKGRHVMMGYLNNEEKTKEAFLDDGWLKSGKKKIPLFVSKSQPQIIIFPEVIPSGNCFLYFTNINSFFNFFIPSFPFR